MKLKIFILLIIVCLFSCSLNWDFSVSNINADLSISINSFYYNPATRMLSFSDFYLLNYGPMSVKISDAKINIYLSENGVESLLSSFTPTEGNSDDSLKQYILPYRKLSLSKYSSFVVDYIYGGIGNLIVKVDCAKDQKQDNNSITSTGIISIKKLAISTIALDKTTSNEFGDKIEFCGNSMYLSYSKTNPDHTYNNNIISADITDINNPIIQNDIADTIIYKISGNTMISFYTGGASTMDYIIKITDLTNQSSPVITNTYTYTGSDEIVNIYTNGSYMYLLMINEANTVSYLKILDISVPGTITETAAKFDLYTGYVYSKKFLNQFFLYNNYLFVNSNSKLYAVNVSNPSSPVKSTYSYTETVDGMYISDNFLYLCNSSSLKIYDILNPENWISKTSFSLVSHYGINQIVAGDNFIIMNNSDSSLTKGERDASFSVYNVSSDKTAISLNKTIDMNQGIIVAMAERNNCLFINTAYYEGVRTDAATNNNYDYFTGNMYIFDLNFLLSN